MNADLNYSSHKEAATTSQAESLLQLHLGKINGCNEYMIDF